MNSDLIELQNRVAFQEDAIHQLNLTVTRQQNENNTLRLALQELHRQLRSLSPSDDATGDPYEIPPHY